MPTGRQKKATERGRINFYGLWEELTLIAAPGWAAPEAIICLLTPSGRSIRSVLICIQYVCRPYIILYKVYMT